MERYIQFIENSPMFAGVMMLLLNIGSRYITHEYSDNDEEYMQNIILRRISIFAVCFIGTRSVITSMLLTAAFVILASGIFRGKSVYAREGMTANQTVAMRAAAGLPQVDEPAYVKDKELFTTIPLSS
jgi:hypothetical protein